jgi:hypothetical protein
MNTQEELQVAFDEYQKGTFIKHSSEIHSGSIDWFILL